MPSINASCPGRLCFVIGPIGTAGSAIRKHADLLLNSIVRHVLEQPDFAYRVKRADEDADPGMIGERMIIDIINADLVVADLTNLNPNVFYEMGIRHTVKKPIIHLASEDTKLPFDNISHRTIFFDLTDWHSTEACRIRLAASAKATQDEGYQVTNPVSQANATFKLSESEDPKDRYISELRSRIDKIESKIIKPDGRSIKIQNINRVDLPRVQIFMPGHVESFVYQKDRVFGDIIELISRQANVNLLDENYKWKLLVDGEVIVQDIKKSNLYFQTFEDIGIDLQSYVSLQEGD